MAVRPTSKKAIAPARRGKSAAQTPSLVARTTEIIGGQRVLKHAIRDRADVHDLIVHGMPYGAIEHLLSTFRHLEPQTVGDAVGVSLRTLQRRRNQPTKPLRREQSDRTWQFTELLVKAAAILGSQEEAERWFNAPAMALDRRRPIDLVGSSVGARMVEQLLDRIEYGVYT